MDEREQTLADIEKLRIELARMTLPATVKQASFLLGISERSVAKYCLVKGLGTRVGDVWLIDVAALIDSAARTSQPDQTR
jgi:hypothetical protein